MIITSNRHDFTTHHYWVIKATPVPCALLGLQYVFLPTGTQRTVRAKEDGVTLQAGSGWESFAHTLVAGVPTLKAARMVGKNKGKEGREQRGTAQ